ncbi:transcription-repair-coupling factor [Arenimonas maotaiensis]|uniref:Transcription-repair-coupling factor n=1 Tax=Arenimonas maotaiensis TaxID=1446479 RepID=A0A917CC49_9GAMM|nr:transcription-repair-coupling factor [Arenimonas maotaiensis]
MDSALLPKAASPHKITALQVPANGAALAYALLRHARAADTLQLVVTPDSFGAQQLEQDLRAFRPELPILHFPDWETLVYDQFSPHPDLVSQRIDCLYRLPGSRRGVLVVPVSSLMQRIAPAEWIAAQVLDLAVGQRLDLGEERLRLQRFGYRHVPRVMDAGDFSIRGAILDLFPSGAEQPIRIELLDDSIDSLRLFDPETQRSGESRTRFKLLPAREFPLDADSCKRARGELLERFDINPRTCGLYADLKEGVAPAGIEYYLPLFFEHTGTLADYLPGGVDILLAPNALDAADHFWQQVRERHEQRRHDIERPILAPDELYIAPDELRARLNRGHRYEFRQDGGELAVQPLDVGPAPACAWQDGQSAAGDALRTFLQAYPGRVILAADSAGRREALKDLVKGAGIETQVAADWPAALAAAAPGTLTLAAAGFSDGFSLREPALAVLTERQLFPERASQSRRRKSAAKSPEAILRDLNEISIGSPIVHEDHGVGRYQGLISLEAGGSVGEFLSIEYAKGDKLYVPVAQLHLVSRYSGADADHAPLHSLGGEAWEKAKRRAADKVRDVAAELLEIQAKRQAQSGFGLALDRPLYERFAAAFPFEETPDQQQAIEAVLADMAQNNPMDRVVCGDVGFGKTEVALRAAFVAAMAGKQVAVLVPTTLLAEQHFRNFSDRFADWPIKVEVLSRFKSVKEVKQALELLALGKIDVIIGTHRLLQKDVAFDDLGLVIVDEEQRFGVRHKEALKALKANVHLLTLTATPIPRTLNMAMSGLRQLSIIGTPPAHRTAVKTFICPWDDATLLEACQRELARGGQIYFLHNDIDTIEKTARELGVLVPDARIRVAHGQMPERQLEQVMLDFHKQRFNILVSTTIIESGIDIPSANTIIINRADRFGLAQLHQLRGRVGRSHHRAYAYLIVPDMKRLTADARKRLDALASLEELGAGFTLSTHDLEIRGAGELLGEGQSGQIAEIGFALYAQYLERAVASIKDGRIPDVFNPAARASEVNLHSPALIPEHVIEDVHTRLTLYKRIASADSDDALRDLQVEMIDRFGLLEPPTQHLLDCAGLRLQAQRLGIVKIDLHDGGGSLLFSAKPAVDPMAVIRLIQRNPKTYAMQGPERLKISNKTETGEQRVMFLRALLAQLGSAT